MSEWLKVHAWKACMDESSSGVQIPLSPHNIIMKKTKIIATLGPSSSNRDIISKMIDSGMNIARINMSHTSIDNAKELIIIIREESKRLDANLSIMMDLCGPKIRVNFLSIDEKFNFKEKQILTIGQGNVDIPVNYALDFSEMNDDAIIKIDDGKFSFRIKSFEKGILTVSCNEAGEIQNGKGINFPGLALNIPAVTDKDLDNLELSLSLDVDWIALSFIRNVSDIAKVKDFFIRKGKSIPLIAKIEKSEAINNLDEIIDTVDGILVARGDLGVELPIKELPILQKKIVNKCLYHHKPVIIATQMLETMINDLSPTRAEVNDIANAIYDGVDAVMLSGETAVGKHPIESINMMNSIAESVEKDFDLLNFSRYIHKHTIDRNDNRSSICHAAMTISNQMDVKGIVIMTDSGTTALKMAQYRPNATIFAISPHLKICQKLSLIWGIIAIHVNKYKYTDDMISKATTILKNNKYISKGDKFLITAGVPIGISGSTNMIKIHVAD